ncbi:MAG: glycosyltransferase family 2 protein [Candidatus Aminicenantales bacterium]
MTPRLSVLIPVKNVEPWLTDAVRSVQALPIPDWEIVIADDHSEDGTRNLALGLAREDPRIKVVDNPGRGIVAGLSAAYAVSSGGHVKFLDGDDVLSPRFGARIPDILAEEASIHDAEIVDEKLAPLSLLRLTGRFAAMPFAEVLHGGIVSPPRWAWTFSRRIGDVLFPLPDLPSIHEDFWVALVIKKTAVRIVHFAEALYLYRQRSGQVFGGLFNFSSEAVRRRAAGMGLILKAVEDHAAFFSRDVPDFGHRLAAMQKYYELMSRPRVSTKDILRLRLPWGRALKLWIVRKMPRTASALSRFKSKRASWWLTRLK